MKSARTRLNFGALRDPSLRRLLAAQLTSVSGDYIVIAALPFAVFSIGGSTAQVSIAFGTGALLEIALVLFGGVIGDRFQRRAVMIAADLVRFGSQAIFAALLIFGVAEFWQVVLVQVIQGAGMAFFNPAMSGLMPEVVDERRLQDANALHTIAVAAAAMLGPALAGSLLATAGAGWAFALDAATFLASAALLSRVRVRFPAAPAPSTSPIAALAEGWTEFRRRTWLWVVVAEFALLNALVFAPFQVLNASIANESLGGPGAWTAILTAAGLGQLAGGLLALAWRPRRPLFAVTLLLIFWAAPLVLLASGAPLAAIVAAAAVAGTTLGLFDAIWHTTLQSNVLPDQRSRLSSYDWLGSLALLPLGYLLTGLAQALIGADATLIVAAFVVVLATAVVVPLPSIRRLRSPEPRRALAPAAATSGSGTAP